MRCKILPVVNTKKFWFIKIEVQIVDPHPVALGKDIQQESEQLGVAANTAQEFSLN